MTEGQQEKVTHMRLMGESYGAIAACLAISRNTIKSFCRRNNLSGDKAADERQAGVALCAYCGKEVPQVEHRKPKKYCSDSCRAHWWNAHRHLITRRSMVSFRCVNCGAEFMDYRGTSRKYCCHKCYIADRFGGGENEQRSVSARKAVSDHHAEGAGDGAAGACFGE